MYMFNLCYCCYSKPILDVADNKFAESAAVLMLKFCVGEEITRTPDNLVIPSHSSL